MSCCTLLYCVSLHFERSSDLLFRSWVGYLNVKIKGFLERQSRHRLLVLLYAGMGFGIDQETSGVDLFFISLFEIDQLFSEMSQFNERCAVK